MSKTETKIYDCFGNQVFHTKNHFESFIVVRKKLAYDNGELVVVERGTEDTRALVQSEKCNAGLENLKKQLALRYGTLENAQARLQQNQVYADVSDIPDNPAGQAAWTEQNTQRLQALANQLGVSIDDLLSMTEATYNSLIQNQQNQGTEQGTNQEGGNE